MTAPRASLAHIDRMRYAMETALRFTANLDYDGFVADIRTIYATERALEIADEAAKQVPDQVRNLDPGIPWRQMAETGDFILYRYDEVNLLDIWDTVQGSLRELLPRLERLQHLAEPREVEEREHE